MSLPEITYVFRDNITYAIHQGKVIASSSDPDEVEAHIKQAFGEPNVHEVGQQFGGQGMLKCPQCGAEVPPGSPACPHCGLPEEEVIAGQHQGMEEMYPQEQGSPGYELGGEAGSYLAKVVTPSGLQGTLLGKVAGIWGDEVTVRLENGRIVKLPTGTELRSVKTAAVPRVNPIRGLEARLASTPDGTRASLMTRADELVGLRHEAAALIRDGVSYADSLRLDQLVVTAEVEQAEIVDAIAHLDDVDAYQPPTFSIGAAHTTAGISREDASWLDHTLDDMIKEAEATDFTKLMDEGPEAFAAEQPDVALADTGVTRQMASSFISEKTAGVAREIAEPYMETFLARVEECRRAELAGRKTTTHKEAAAAEDQYKDLPDDALFL